ncbi:hypothetical protein BDN70DRAFT_870301 [Pholiota conissans]|uniref:Uncharacterized protein n=1 Tax=Pholiota conissans TaxID=109636 RepID=A0A9P5ZF00_9AGAR|nr:hypothetical protein BDN70DRAFT_870301 [Pholiota conissans]
MLSSRLIAGKLTRRRYLLSASTPSTRATTTVERGNAFEQRSLDLLGQTMSMSLTRVGGKEDGGIDLLGWWWLPYDKDNADASTLSPSSEARRRIRVIGQCKAEKKKMGPKYVRELEGVLFRFSAMSSEDSPLQLFPLEQQSSTPVVALLISESSFTKSTVLRAHSSPIPFFLLHLPPLEDAADAQTDASPAESAKTSSGQIGSALCNPALIGSQGLLKGQLEIRWERHSLGRGGRPALWWNHERLQSHIPPLETPELGQISDDDSQPSSL